MTFERPQREVSKVFIHCSASDHLRHDDPAAIAEWHLARGWDGIGYHYVITKDGTIHDGRSLEKIPAAQKGHNTGSIAVCLTGLHIYSVQQMRSLIDLCIEIDDAYNREVTFHGHKEVNEHKACPVFGYKHVLQLRRNGHLRRT